MQEEEEEEEEEIDVDSDELYNEVTTTLSRPLQLKRNSLL